MKGGLVFYYKEETDTSIWELPTLGDYKQLYKEAITEEEEREDEDDNDKDQEQGKKKQGKSGHRDRDDTSTIPSARSNGLGNEASETSEEYWEGTTKLTLPTILYQAYPANLILPTIPYRPYPTSLTPPLYITLSIPILLSNIHPTLPSLSYPTLVILPSLSYY